MVELNWVDYTIIGLVGLSVIISLFRGFVKETISIITWGLAIWLSVLFSELTASLLSHYVSSEPLRYLLAFAGIFICVLILGALVNFFIGALVKSTGFGGTDRILGVLFGFARGVLVTSLLLLVVSLTSFQDQSWWKKSKLVPEFKPLMAWLDHYVPSNLKHFENDYTEEKAMAEQVAIQLSENINPATTHLPS
jgi:membrane protein required for colicin V production